MSAIAEWAAISARISGLLEAGNFFLTCQGVRSDDPYGAGRLLVRHANEIFESLKAFDVARRSELPTAATATLETFLSTSAQHFRTVPQEPRGALQFGLTALSLFRAQFDFNLADFEAVARRLSERAFVHLQRSIVASDDERQKWKTAFARGELACEKLGAVHLLMHGIWAFKADAAGERTDLIFGGPLTDLVAVERSADALVLTEWKKLRTPAEAQTQLGTAKAQAARYTKGSLAWIIHER